VLLIWEQLVLVVQIEKKKGKWQVWEETKVVIYELKELL
jgi:hypothetical protein